MDKLSVVMCSVKVCLATIGQTKKYYNYQLSRPVTETLLRMNMVMNTFSAT